MNPTMHKKKTKRVIGQNYLPDLFIWIKNLRNASTSYVLPEKITRGYIAVTP